MSDETTMIELRQKIEAQRTMIQVALGYIQSGRPEIAALLLANEATAEEKEGA